jgi:RNA 3'-terminal phosphate cyclase-like protein
MKELDGSNFLRQRIVLSLISGTPVRISNIRAEQGGIVDYEASFIRLVEKITNGSRIEINHTGTQLVFFPGVIIGGPIYHECPNSRAMGYFLEPLLVLCPFGKLPLVLEMTGVTNNNCDVSVDLLRTCVLPQLPRFGIVGADLKIKARGALPNGGGRVLLNLPTIKSVSAFQFLDPGKVSKIRGIAYCTRISPQMANRMQEAARSILTRFIPNVFIYTDVFKGDESGKSPGYALSLVAETDTDVRYSTECAYKPRLDENDIEENLQNDYAFPAPEDLGIRVARQILQEIKNGGTIDAISQWIHVMFMAIGPEDVSKVRVGTITPFT